MSESEGANLKEGSKGSDCTVNLGEISGFYNATVYNIVLNLYSTFFSISRLEFESVVTRSS